MEAITVEHLWKGFWLGQSSMILQGYLPSFFRAFGSRAKGRERFWALEDVSVGLRRGESLGIVGLNGSGKSTLLKLLTKIMKPDKGRITIRGTVAALIELGAGFHPELTGRENIFLNGVILGLTQREIERKFEDIVEFSGISDFIDTPVKRYSSGMFVRLGFSVAAHMNPDILLIDEVLAVGDYQFQDKCVGWLRDFRSKERTVVVVSHNRVKIEQLCDRAVLLHKGQVIRDDEPNKVMDDYYEMFNPVDGESFNERVLTQTMKNKPIWIEKVEMRDSHGKPATRIRGGEPASIVIRYRAEEDISEPVFFYRIFRADGVVAHGNHMVRAGIKFNVKTGERGEVIVCFSALNLLSGNYYLDAGIMRDIFSSSRYDWKFKVAPFYVETESSEGVGISLLNHEWKINRE